MKEIFKYVLPERIDILKNLKIRFTQHSYLNDPFDLILPAKTIFPREMFDKYFAKNELFKNVPQIPFLEKLLKDQGKTLSEFHDSLYENLQFLFTQENDLTKEFLKKEFDKEFGVLSLTESPDNIAMWAYYASDHKGFVIIFNFDHSFFNHGFLNDKDCGILKKVNYETDLMVLESFMDLKTTGAEFLFRKGIALKGENEWRMLLPLKMASQIIKKDIYLFDIPLDAIVGVILGERCDDYLANEINELKNSSSELQHLEIYKAVSNKNEYKMDYVPYVNL